MHARSRRRRVRPSPPAHFLSVAQSGHLSLSTSHTTRTECDVCCLLPVLSTPRQLSASRRRRHTDSAHVCMLWAAGREHRALLPQRALLLPRRKWPRPSAPSSHSVSLCRHLSCAQGERASPDTQTPAPFRLPQPEEPHLRRVHASGSATRLRRHTPTVVLPMCSCA